MAKLTVDNKINLIYCHNFFSQILALWRKLANIQGKLIKKKKKKKKKEKETDLRFWKQCCNGQDIKINIINKINWLLPQFFIQIFGIMKRFGKEIEEVYWEN